VGGRELKWGLVAPTPPHEDRPAAPEGRPGGGFVRIKNMEHHNNSMVPEIQGQLFSQALNIQKPWYPPFAGETDPSEKLVDILD